MMRASQACGPGPSFLCVKRKTGSLQKKTTAGVRFPAAALFSKPNASWPRFDTVLMVEDAIKNSDDYLTKTQLWRKLPRKVMYQTFKTIIEYLEQNNCIIVTKDGKLVWVRADNEKLRRLLAKSVKAN